MDNHVIESKGNQRDEILDLAISEMLNSAPLYWTVAALGSAATLERYSTVVTIPTINVRSELVHLKFLKVEDASNE